MKSVYITSVERYSGKTAVCLALGKRLQSEGKSVGYIKPLSLQPWQIEGHIADEDAAFVKETLGLKADVWDLSPVVVTTEVLREHIEGDKPTDLMEKVKSACEEAASGHDVLLLEGGGSLREGYVMGLPTPTVAAAVGSHVLTIVKFREQIRLLDDALTAKNRLGDSMSGILINRVPEDAAEFVATVARPFLEEQGVPVFGVIPEVRTLAAITVGELIDLLKANVLTEMSNRDAMVETLTVGAMHAEAALSRLRKYKNKAVITGGDRTDIQLAALETSTTCVILTGNLKPSSLIIKQANQLKVPVLLVHENTMETVESIENVFGKTRLGQSAKLQQFQELLEQHVELERLYEQINLSTK